MKIQIEGRTVGEVESFTLRKRADLKPIYELGLTTPIYLNGRTSIEDIQLKLVIGKPMGKKYKGSDGEVLAIDEDARSGLWSIGWDFPFDGIGAYLGETSEEFLQDDANWEMRIAQAAAKPFADEDEEGYGKYLFPSKKAAQQALTAANGALLRGDQKPWPAWAAQAKAAGWTPPKGWKP
jgi:hypothetical protein